LIPLTDVAHIFPCLHPPVKEARELLRPFSLYTISTLSV